MQELNFITYEVKVYLFSGEIVLKKYIYPDYDFSQFTHKVMIYIQIIIMISFVRVNLYKMMAKEMILINLMKIITQIFQLHKLECMN